MADLRYIKLKLLDGGLTKEATVTYFSGKHTKLDENILKQDLDPEVIDIMTAGQGNVKSNPLATQGTNNNA
jgi:hypothetical protein